MKKVLLLLALIIFSGSCGFASDICQTGYDLTSGWSRFASRVSGSNYLHKTMLEKYLENEAGKYVDGKIKVKIDSFSTADLKDGKFKNLSATAENLVYEGVSASKITLNSVCLFNQIAKTEDSKIRFLTDFPANVTVELSADDLNRLTSTTDFKKAIKAVNQNTLGFLRIESLNFEVKENKLWYNFQFSTPFSPKIQTAKIGTEVYLSGGDVNISSSETSSKPTILSILNMSGALNYVNPLDFSLKILENSIAQVNEVSIENDKIILKAFVNIKK